MKRTLLMSALVLMSVLGLSSCGSGSSIAQPERVPPVGMSSAGTFRQVDDMFVRTPLNAGLGSQGFINCLNSGEPCVKTVFWTDGQIPYKISPYYSTSQRQIIQDYINKFNSIILSESNSALKWIPATSTTADYVLFYPYAPTDCYGNTGCSYVGKKGGEQILYVLPDNIDLQTYTLAHEMGHAMGLAHEHQRCDRDSYIVVTATNDPKGTNKLCGTSAIMVYGYDYHSMMHYPNSAGMASINPNTTGTYKGVTYPFVNNQVGPSYKQSRWMTDTDIAALITPYPAR